MTWDQADFAMQLGHAVTHNGLGQSVLMRRPASAPPPPGYEQELYEVTSSDTQRYDWRAA